MTEQLTKAIHGANLLRQDLADLLACQRTGSRAERLAERWAIEFLARQVGSIEDQLKDVLKEHSCGDKAEGWKPIGTEEIKLRLRLPTHEFVKLFEQRGRIFELSRLSCSAEDTHGLRDVVIDLVPDNGIAIIDDSGVDTASSGR